MSKFTEYMLKLLIGFSGVMMLIYLIYIAKTYPEQLALFVASIISLVGCYLLGSSIWNIVEDFFNKAVDK